MTHVAVFITILCSTTVFAQMDTLFHDGRNRTYLVHLPPSYDGSEATPLVVGLHGGLTTAEQMEGYSQLSVKADEAGFIVVYASGTGVDHSWNAGTCCGIAAFLDVDDVGFMGVLIDTLRADYNIDPQQIFATGISNGGMMCYRIACEAPELFAAIAPIAASLMMEDCEPAAPLPLIHFHSRQDTRVPYEGGFGEGPSGDIYRPPVDSVIAAFAGHNGCTAGPDTIFTADSAYGVQWAGCDEGADVALYVTLDGGHSWPGGETLGFPGADPPSQAISANDLMWDFFVLHPQPVQVHATPVMPESLMLRPAFPNPFNAVTEIVFELSHEADIQLDIIDLNGREVVRLTSGEYSAGIHHVTFDAHRLASGIYFCRLTSGAEMSARKLMLLK